MVYILTGHLSFYHTVVHKVQFVHKHGHVPFVALIINLISVKIIKRQAFVDMVTVVNFFMIGEIIRVDGKWKKNLQKKKESVNKL
jgi:hypothetical protein